MLDLLEPVLRRPAHAVRRGVRRAGVGVGLLEVAERAEQPVVLGVADEAPAVGVVRPGEVADDRAEVGGERGGLGLRRGRGGDAVEQPEGGAGEVHPYRAVASESRIRWPVAGVIRSGSPERGVNRWPWNT